MINKIGIGTVQFGLKYGISNNDGITSIDEAKKIISSCRGLGIDTLDTASAYGQSESTLGEIGISNFKIVTKFSVGKNNTTIDKQLQNSLNKLRISKVYGLLAHNSIEVLKDNFIWDKLNKVKDLGYVEKIGFSFNALREAEEVLLKGYIPDLVQVPFNYLDKRYEAIMIQLRKAGCEIHSRSPFLQGLFFTNPNELPSFFDDIKPILIDLQKNRESLPGKLLKYCLNKPYIDKVIFGVNNYNQFIENISNLKHITDLPEISTSVNDSILTPSFWPPK